MQTEAGTVRVVRPQGGWRDLARAYRIEVDGQPRGKVRRGETLEIGVSAGRHVVQARIDWTGSRELVVEVAAGSAVTCRVEPAGHPGQALAQAGSIDTYLALSQVSE